MALFKKRKVKKELKPNFYPNLIDNNINFNDIFSGGIGSYEPLKSELVSNFKENWSELINKGKDIFGLKQDDSELINDILTVYIQRLKDLTKERKEIRVELQEIVNSGDQDDEKFKIYITELNRITATIADNYIIIENRMDSLKDNQAKKLIMGAIDVMKSMTKSQDEENNLMLLIQEKKIQEPKNTFELELKKTELLELEKKFDTLKSITEKKEMVIMKYEKEVRDLQIEIELGKETKSKYEVLLRDFESLQDELKLKSEELLDKYKAFDVLETTPMALPKIEESNQLNNELMDLKKKFDDLLKDYNSEIAINNSNLIKIKEFSEINTEFSSKIVDFENLKVTRDSEIAQLEVQKEKLRTKKKNLKNNFKLFKEQLQKYIDLTKYLEVASNTEEFQNFDGDNGAEKLGILIKQLQERNKDLETMVDDKYRENEIFRKTIKDFETETSLLITQNKEFLQTIEGYEMELKLNSKLLDDYMLIITDIKQTLIIKILMYLELQMHEYKDKDLEKYFKFDEGKKKIVFDNYEFENYNITNNLEFINRLVKEFKFRDSFGIETENIMEKMTFLKQQMNVFYEKNNENYKEVVEIRRAINENKKLIADLSVQKMDFSIQAIYEKLVLANDSLYNKTTVMSQEIKKNLNMHLYMHSQQSSIKFYMQTFDKTHLPILLNLRQVIVLLKLYDVNGKSGRHNPNIILTDMLKYKNVRFEIAPLVSKDKNYLKVFYKKNITNPVLKIAEYCYVLGNVRSTKVLESNSFEFIQEPIYFLLGRYFTKLAYKPQIYEWSFICQIVHTMLVQTKEEKYDRKESETVHNIPHLLEEKRDLRFMPIFYYDAEEEREFRNETLFKQAIGLSEEDQNDIIYTCLMFWLNHVVNIWKILRFGDIYIKQQCDYLNLEYLCKNFKWYMTENSAVNIFFMFKKFIFHLFSYVEGEDVYNFKKKIADFEYFKIRKNRQFTWYKITDINLMNYITEIEQDYLKKDYKLSQKDVWKRAFTHFDKLPAISDLDKGVKNETDLETIWTPTLPMTLKLNRPTLTFEEELNYVMKKKDLYFMQKIVMGICDRGYETFFSWEDYHFTNNLIAIVLETTHLWDRYSRFFYGYWVKNENMKEDEEDYGFSMFLFDKMLTLSVPIEQKEDILKSQIQENENLESYSKLAPGSIFYSFINSSINNRIEKNALFGKNDEVDIERLDIEPEQGMIMKLMDESKRRKKDFNYDIRRKYPDIGQFSIVDEKELKKDLSSLAKELQEENI